MLTAIRSNPLFDTTTTTGTTGTKAADPPVGAAEPTPTTRVLPTNPSGMGKDEFLKMLVAQLRNQDPLNPMDGKDMAAQLAQFSSVEQLQELNTSMTAAAKTQDGIAKAIDALSTSQTQSSDTLQQMIEGQMAMSTVGKTGVTTGNSLFVDRDGSGSIVIDAGTMHGPGRVTITDSKGSVVGIAALDNVATGQQSYDVRDLHINPPLAAGAYTFKAEVAGGGSLWNAVKTYSSGRITGLKYNQGNPILIIGGSLEIPMSQLTQIRS